MLYKIIVCNNMNDIKKLSLWMYFHLSYSKQSIFNVKFIIPRFIKRFKKMSYFLILFLIKAFTAVLLTLTLLLEVKLTIKHSGCILAIFATFLFCHYQRDQLVILKPYNGLRNIFQLPKTLLLVLTLT